MDGLCDFMVTDALSFSFWLGSIPAILAIAALSRHFIERQDVPPSGFSRQPEAGAGPDIKKTNVATLACLI